MRRVIFVQPLLDKPGGANLVAAWMIQALTRDYRVMLLTWAPPDLDEVRRYFGVDLGSSNLSIVTMPSVVRRLFALDPDSHSVQPFCLLLRLSRAIKRPGDILITGMNEVDFGGEGIQYIHYPAFSQFEDHDYERLSSRLGKRLRPWRLLAGYSYARMRQNLTLVNSDWTGRVVRRVYGIDSITLYPPVAESFPVVPWEARENGLVCIGRFHPEKRLEAVIAIVAAARAQVPDLHLHLIGTPLGDSRAGRDYFETLKRLVQARGEWVQLHERVSREEMVRLIVQHRYGIHGMPREHFGLAVAEMVMGGCLPFVPNDGGQVEIVGHDARLIYDYSAIGDAVAKIVHVARHPAEQAALRRQLAARRQRFSIDHFTRQLREIVAQHADATAGGIAEPADAMAREGR